jgi:hypothetical protein
LIHLLNDDETRLFFIGDDEDESTILDFCVESNEVNVFSVALDGLGILEANSGGINAISKSDKNTDKFAAKEPYITQSRVPHLISAAVTISSITTFRASTSGSVNCTNLYFR